MPKSDRDATLGDLLVQMKLTNRLLAAPLKTTMGQQDLIKLLMSTGASPQEIADVLDTTAGTVSTTIQRLRKKMAKPDGGSASEQENG